MPCRGGVWFINDRVTSADMALSQRGIVSFSLAALLLILTTISFIDGGGATTTTWMLFLVTTAVVFIALLSTSEREEETVSTAGASVAAGSGHETPRTESLPDPAEAGLDIPVL